MANRQTTTLAVAVAVAASLSGARPAAAENLEPMIVLHVHNCADVPAPDLAKAEAEATQVYRDIGVHAVWTEEDATTAVADGARHLTVLILSREMADRKVKADGLAANVLGIATNATGQAYIFPDRIALILLKKPQSGYHLLAKVLAHEVGHLLLPVNSHSPRGIMAADLDLRPGLRHFTTAQGKTIRARLLDGTLATTAHE